MSEADALRDLNRLKDKYQTLTSYLQDLKQTITSSDLNLEASLRSRLRIDIETFLIDINEETFSISELMAQLYSTEASQYLDPKSEVRSLEKQYRKIEDSVTEKIRLSKDVQGILKLQTSEDDYYQPLRQSPERRSTSPLARKLPARPPTAGGFMRTGGSALAERVEKEMSGKKQREASGSKRDSLVGTRFGPAPDQLLPRGKLARVVTTEASLERRGSRSRQQQPKPQRSSHHFKTMDSPSKREVQKKEEQTRRAFQDLQEQLVDKNSFKRRPSSRQGLQTIDPRQGSGSHWMKNQVQAEAPPKFETALFLADPLSKPPQHKFNPGKDNDDFLSLAPDSRFSEEFALMKKLVARFQKKIESQDEKILELSSQMSKLSQVNLKLNADNKVIREKQDTLMHQMYLIEKKNSSVTSENYDLKRKIKLLEERKSHEIDMPLQQPPSMVNPEKEDFLSFRRPSDAFRGNPNHQGFQENKLSTIDQIDVAAGYEEEGPPKLSQQSPYPGSSARQHRQLRDHDDNLYGHQSHQHQLPPEHPSSGYADRGEGFEKQEVDLTDYHRYSEQAQKQLSSRSGSRIGGNAREGSETRQSSQRQYDNEGSCSSRLNQFKRPSSSLKDQIQTLAEGPTKVTSGRKVSFHTETPLQIPTGEKKTSFFNALMKKADQEAKEMLRTYKQKQAEDTFPPPAGAHNFKLS